MLTRPGSDVHVAPSGQLRSCRAMPATAILLRLVTWPWSGLVCSSIVIWFGIGCRSINEQLLADAGCQANDGRL